MPKLSAKTERATAIMIVAIICFGPVFSPLPANLFERSFCFAGAVVVGGWIVNGFVRSSARMAFLNGLVWLGAFVASAISLLVGSPKASAPVTLLVVINEVLILVLALLSLDLWSRWKKPAG